MASLDVLMANSAVPPGMALKMQTRVGDDYITPSFQKHLENYYNKASPADQAKCLELVAAVHLGEDLNDRYPVPRTFPTKIPKDIRRCKSAMAKIGDIRGSNAFKTFNTTYERDYPPKVGASAVADRPATSKGYATTCDVSGPIGLTNYMDEYGHKPHRPASPIRSGSASGERKNKPHPKEAFMIWRFPSHGRKKYVQPVQHYEALANEKVNHIHKQLYTSTYQKDYLGIPQGFQMKSAFDVPPDWKGNVPYSTESHNRTAYRYPVQHPELMLPSTRYGSNAQKNIPSIGSIPTINRYLLDLKARTTYDRHFNENASAVSNQIRDVSRHLNVEALKKFYNTACGEEREVVGNMLESLKLNKQPRSRTPGVQTLKCCDTRWPGPPPKTRETLVRPSQGQYSETIQSELPAPSSPLVCST